MPCPPASSVRDARAALGWSAARLGMALGVTGRAVRLWEAEQRPTPVAVLMLLGLWLHPALPKKLRPTIRPPAIGS